MNAKAKNAGMSIIYKLFQLKKNQNKEIESSERSEKFQTDLFE